MRGDVETATFRYHGQDVELAIRDETPSGGYTTWAWQAMGAGYHAHSTGDACDSPSTAFGRAVMQVIADAQRSRSVPAESKIVRVAEGAETE